MRVRALTVAVFVLAPLALLTAAIVVRANSDRDPAQLPIDPAATQAEGVSFGPVRHQAAADLPSLTGSARAYRFVVDAEIGGGLSEAPVSNQPDGARPADLPTRAQAERIAREFLAQSGFDVDHARFSVSDNHTSWYITADPVVEGLPTSGLAGTVVVGAEGRIERASGYVGHVEEADEYPLIGTTAAIAGLAVPELATTEGVVTITGAERALMAVPATTGADMWLVPAYLFTTDSGATIPALAIDHSYLAPSSEPEPEPAVATDSDISGSGTPGDPGSGELPAAPSMTIEPQPGSACAPATTAVGANEIQVCD